AHGSGSWLRPLPRPQGVPGPTPPGGLFVSGTGCFVLTLEVLPGCWLGKHRLAKEMSARRRRHLRADRDFCLIFYETSPARLHGPSGGRRFAASLPPVRLSTSRRARGEPLLARVPSQHVGPRSS